MASSPASGAKVYIPITDDLTTLCTSYYNVQWRYRGTTIWNTFTVTSPLPVMINPSGSPAGEQPTIILPLVVSGQEYDLQVQRFCCDGSNSIISSTTFTT